MPCDNHLQPTVLCIHQRQVTPKARIPLRVISVSYHSSERYYHPEGDCFLVRLVIQGELSLWPCAWPICSTVDTTTIIIIAMCAAVGVPLFVVVLFIVLCCCIRGCNNSSSKQKGQGSKTMISAIPLQKVCDSRIVCCNLQLRKYDSCLTELWDSICHPCRYPQCLLVMVMFVMDNWP